MPKRIAYLDPGNTPSFWKWVAGWWEACTRPGILVREEAEETEERRAKAKVQEHLQRYCITLSNGTEAWEPGTSIRSAPLSLARRG